MRLVGSIVLAILLFGIPAHAGIWDEPRRGSWLTEGDPVLGDVVLARDGRVCEIVVSSEEDSPVHVAAGFLAGDINKICGVRPSVVEQPTKGIPSIHLSTLGQSEVPPKISENLVAGAWEEYVVSISGSDIWLVGSNPNGTAFAVYELCERMGVDPLHHWTGYEPVVRNPLALQSGVFIRTGPAFRFRGMFHDDEDILPQPLDDRGYPSQTGVIETQWYERWFETALRLRCNMVAPYVRVERRYEIQQMASDWGLCFTGHHYDVLLSNPWGYERFELAEERSVEGDYNWIDNKYSLLDYWEAGVVENRKLDCIWPVGLRGTQDKGYIWPDGTTQQQKNAAYTEAIGTQQAIVNTILEADKPRLYHFTLYNEMLENYQAGNLLVPEDVIIVWDDDGDGVMRGLPESTDTHRSGVYYHLAFLGETRSKQGAAHTVSPERISSEFRQIVEAGATEFLMLNVSELRDVVMETRMVMDIAWQPELAFHDEKQGNGFVDWWAKEYFAQNADAAAEAYEKYYELLPDYDWQWKGSEQIEQLLKALQKKFAGTEAPPPGFDEMQGPMERSRELQKGMQACSEATKKLSEVERQFFYENAVLAILIEYRHTNCAIRLQDALRETDIEKAWVMVQQALTPLTLLEKEIKVAERAPFEGWYNHTWIRYRSSAKNIHRPMAQLSNFWESGGMRIDAEDE